MKPRKSPKKLLSDALLKPEYRVKPLNHLVDRMDDIHVLAVINEWDSEFIRNVSRNVFGGKSFDRVGLARLLVDASPDNLIKLCYEVTPLCTSDFWKAMLMDVFPDIFDVFIPIDLTNNTRAWYDTVFAPYPVSSQEGPDEEEETLQTYAVEEKLYATLLHFGEPVNHQALVVFEQLINDEPLEYKKGMAEFVWKFPLLVILLQNKFPILRKWVIIADSPDYEFLNRNPAERIGLLRSGNLGPNILRVLLEKERFSSLDYTTALQNTLTGDDPLTLDILLDYTREKNISLPNTMLVDASKGRLTQMVASLLKDGRIDPRSRNSSALAMAASYGRTDTLKLLLKDGRADPSAGESAALRWATNENRLESVELLLADGRADPSVQNNSIILFLSRRGFVEPLRVLLKDYRTYKGLGAAPAGMIDPSARENEPIKLAVKYKHPGIVRLLLQEPRVNRRNVYIPDSMLI